MIYHSGKSSRVNQTGSTTFPQDYVPSHERLTGIACSANFSAARPVGVHFLRPVARSALSSGEGAMTQDRYLKTQHTSNNARDTTAHGVDAAEAGAEVSSAPCALRTDAIVDSLQDKTPRSARRFFARYRHAMN